MKKYIIITLSITNVGGAEQYVYNKSEFLKKHGYEVYVFSSLDRPIIIKGLKQYRKYIIPALMYSPFIFRKKHVDSIIERVAELSSIQYGDELYIETHNVHPGLWGELIAEKYSGTNVIFNLQEQHNYSEREKKFLWFKLQRKELAGITENSVSQMFGKRIRFRSWMLVQPYCSNVVSDVPDKISVKFDNTAKYTFATLGRLEKGYIIPMISALTQYFRENSNERFNLLLIGGSNKVGVESEIRGMLKNTNNVNLIITGFLYPIPRELIKKVDLFISTSGSCSVTYNEGVKTIKVHPNTAEPTQIMGYSFDDVNTRSMYEVLENTTLLDQVKIALSGIDINYAGTEQSYNEVMNNEFVRQLHYFVNHNNEYYSGMKAFPQLNAKNVLYTILGKTVGERKMQIILEKIRKA